MLLLDSAEQLGPIEGDESSWTSRAWWAAVIDTWQIALIPNVQ